MKNLKVGTVLSLADLCKRALASTGDIKFKAANADGALLSVDTDETDFGLLAYTKEADSRWELTQKTSAKTSVPTEVWLYQHNASLGGIDYAYKNLFSEVRKAFSDSFYLVFNYGAFSLGALRQWIESDPQQKKVILELPGHCQYLLNIGCTPSVLTTYGDNISVSLKEPSAIRNEYTFVPESDANVVRDLISTIESVVSEEDKAAWIYSATSVVNTNASIAIKPAPIHSDGIYNSRFTVFPNSVEFEAQHETLKCLTSLLATWGISYSVLPASEKSPAKVTIRGKEVNSIAIKKSWKKTLYPLIADKTLRKSCKVIYKAIRSWPRQDKTSALKITAAVFSILNEQSVRKEV